MTKRQSKKRTLMTSIISLILSISMLIGTTFSWFTDTVANTGNRIQTGTLKVKLLRYADDTQKYEDISNGVGDIFTTENQVDTKVWPMNGILWEPGKTEVVYLAVENAGKLALNYNIILNVTNDANNEVALEKAFTYALVPGVDRNLVSAYQTWEEILNAAGVQTGAVPVGLTAAAQNGALEANKIDYFALAVHMSEDAGNEYQDQAIEIDVNVTAKQMASEYDSFGNEYDLNASFVQAELYVSPDGDDANEGTIDSPFKTIARAQEEVRKMNDNMWGDIIIYLADGVYSLDETLTFTPEDGGSNGYYVRYVAIGDATISGGRKIEGWTKSTEYENLWEVEVADMRGIGEMYVNDTYARRAESETVGRVISQYQDPGITDENYRTSYPNDGLIVSSDTLNSTFKNVTDIQIRMARAWKDLTLNIEGIIDNGDGTSTLLIPLTPRLSGRDTHGAEAGAGFWIVNAFEHLDIPGEFYYNEVTDVLYYYPREGEDMTTAEVYVPEIEELMSIEGPANYDKVENISFENLTFAHAAWYRDLEHGFNVQQADNIYSMEECDCCEIDNMYMIPAAINLTSTDGISFTRNVFKGFHGAGIGLKNGAANTNIVGNVFEEIGGSAVQVGDATLGTESPVTDGVDIAAGKPVTSNDSDVRTFSSDLAPVNLAESITNPAPGTWQWVADLKQVYGTDPAYSRAWAQIDLQGEYTIDRIEVKPIQNVVARSWFEVQASNDPEFNTYVVLGRQEEASAEWEDLVYEVDDDTKYRYVRFTKAPDSINGWYTGCVYLRVITQDVEYYKPIELPYNTTITDNYITRCGMTNVGAPGITAYYTNNLNLSNNEFYALPYSAVSLGYGWSLYVGTPTGGGNRVANNLIHDIMQITWDGSAIYTLGPQQTETEISGNYIYEVPHYNGGIYMDQASRNLSVYDNVVENVTSVFSIGSLNTSNLKVYDNYFSASESAYDGEDANAAVYSNNIMYVPGDYPLEAIEIIKNSGIREEYQDIKSQDSGRQFEATFDMKHENLINDTPSVMTDERFTRYAIFTRITFLDEFINTIKTDGSVGSYPKEVVDAVHAFSEECKLAAKSSPIDRVELVKAGDKLVEMIEELKNSRVTDTLPDLIAEAKEALANTTIGSGQGQVAQTTYDALKAAVAKSEEVQASGKVELIDRVYLEKSIEAFEHGTIELNILSFSVPEALSDAVIDKENATVIIEVKRSLDLTSVQPIVKVPDGIVVTPSLEQSFDFTQPVKFTLSTEDGSASKGWTVTLVPEAVITGTVVFDERIEDSANWVAAGSSEKKYNGGVYGDSTLKFKMKIDQPTGNSWPSISFRNKYINTTYNGTDGYCYMICFTYESTTNKNIIEFHRFNAGNRTQFYGTLDQTTYGGTDAITNTFLEYGETGDIEIITSTEEEGVRIILKINGTEVFSVLDTSGDALTEGYFGKMETGRNGFVTVMAAE